MERPYYSMIQVQESAWYLQVDAFFQDFSNTDSFEKGPRLKALLRKRKIQDDVLSNQFAIESDLFETSAPSEESDGLLRGLGLSDNSDDAIGIGEALVPDYVGKTPKPHIRALIEKNQRLKQAQEQAATRKQAVSHKGRGKTALTYSHELVHRHDNERYSGSESSNEEIFLTPKTAASNKKRYNQSHDMKV